MNVEPHTVSEKSSAASCASASDAQPASNLAGSTAREAAFSSMRNIDQLNADWMLDDVRVIWNSGTVLLTTRDGKILTVLAITSDIQGKIARWLDKNNMRCTQIHDGKIWL